MTRKATQSPSPPPTPPRATAEALDAPTILARARRVLWALQHDPATARGIDPDAAAAVTHHRHALEGAWFAGRILAEVGEGAGEGEVERAIRTALQGGRR